MNNSLNNNYWIQKKYSYDKEFFDNQNFILNENFTKYSENPPKHVFPIKQSTVNSLGQNIITEYEYPQDRLDDWKMLGLTLNNRISDPVVTKNYVDNQKTSEKLIQYGDNLFPSAVFAKKGTGTINPNQTDDLQITYDKYDSQGNLIQYTPANGTPTSIIWGYNGQYPIAKVEGLPYQDIQTLANTLINQSNNGNLSENSFENLRKKEGAMVTGYIYSPLIGVKAIIQPNGLTEYYEYDSAGRLKQIKDHEGNVLKKIEYNYQQP